MDRKALRVTSGRRDFPAPAGAASACLVKTIKIIAPEQPGGGVGLDDPVPASEHSAKSRDERARIGSNAGLGALFDAAQPWSTS
jgi:hypothetical protein